MNVAEQEDYVPVMIVKKSLYERRSVTCKHKRNRRTDTESYGHWKTEK